MRVGPLKVCAGQQPMKPGLLEVGIRGEGILDSFILHHDEAGAVNQPPVFVGAWNTELRHAP
jgi:hypothetical protein